MKNYYYFLLIPFLLSSCYSTQNYSMLLHEPPKMFWENDRAFAYDESDNLIVSIAFDAKMDGTYIYDLAIDNQSDSAIVFDPSDIYAFCYGNDSTLAHKNRYHPLTSDEVSETINTLLLAEKKQNNLKSAAGIIFGLAIITAGVVLLDSDEFVANETIWLGENITGIAVEEAIYNTTDFNQYAREKKFVLNNEVFLKDTIQSGQILLGKIHFKLPEVPIYKLNIPVNNSNFRFSFCPEQLAQN